MWIKICGLTDPSTAHEIAALKPDAIGLNFYERSVRHVSPQVAREIMEGLSAKVDVVGVFVEASAEIVRERVMDCGLDGIQLHAAGTDDALDSLSDLSSHIKRIRAFQMGPRGILPLTEYFARHPGRESQIDACLVDAHVEGEYGGTGKTLPWDQLQIEYQSRKWPPLILAGGLRVDNVAEAIATVRPWGVDVASGVESSPGVKDVNLVARFIEEARRAFRELEQ